MKKITTSRVITAIVLIWTGAASAQPSQGSVLAGRVLDPSGAMLPGAAVRLESRVGGFEYRTDADERGYFVFSSLSPGTYSLSVETKAFPMLKMEDIALGLDQKMEIDVAMEIGAPNTVIFVKAPSDPIDAANAIIRESLPKAALEQLPIMTEAQSRSVLRQLQLLFPGTSSFKFNGKVDSRGTTLSVNGSTLGGVGFYFDGIDNSNLLGTSGGAATTGPNPDALEEVFVLAQNYGAESGGHQAEVHMRVRSGTNQLHGQARAIRAYPDLGARDFFAAGKGGTNIKSAGFQLSGPVEIPSLYNGHDRTFWFFDNEWTRTGLDLVYSRVFPSDAARSGDFSNLPSELWPVDPSTLQPFPGGRIPQNRILPQSRFYLDEFVPRDPAGGQIPIPDISRASGYQFTTRIDHKLGSRDSLSGSLFYHDNPFSESSGGTIGSRLEAHEQGNNLSVRYVRRMTTQTTNSFSFGRSWYLMENNSIPKYLDVDLVREGYSICNVGTGTSGFPNISMRESVYISSAGYNTKDSISTLQWKDDLSTLRGRHNMKFGIDLRRTGEEYFFSYGAAPSFEFSGFNPGGTRNDIADFLLGIPLSYSQGSDSRVRPGRLLSSLYAQDDVRLKRRLMLNFGLRYELNGALRERDGRNAGFRSGNQSKVFPNAPPDILFAGDFDPLYQRTMDDSIAPANRTNFAPRFGIAWAPATQGGWIGRILGSPGSTSIRAGYGVYYILRLANPAFDITYLPPWAFKVRLNSPDFIVSGGTFLNPWGKNADPFLGTLEQRQFTLPLQGVPYIPPGLKDPWQHQWSLSLQRQFPLGVVLSLAYVGNSTSRLMRVYEANPGRLIPGATPFNVDSRRIYTAFGHVTQYASDGSSMYHGLQITVGRRLGSRLLFNSHYTFSKALDDAGGAGFSSLADGAASPWGRGNGDRRHIFAFYWVSDLPAPSEVKILGPVLSGWRLSGSVQVRSGLPLQIRNPFDSTLQGIAPGMPDSTGPFQEFDPREIRTFRLPNGQTVTGNFLFDPTVFRIVNPASVEEARPGNLGRNVFSGPGAANVDLSLARQFNLKERHQIEMMMDVTNAFNHAQFAVSPASTNPSSIQFGRVTGTAGARVIQFRLYYSF